MGNWANAREFEQIGVQNASRLEVTIRYDELKGARDTQSQDVLNDHDGWGYEMLPIDVDKKIWTYRIASILLNLTARNHDIVCC
jgi:hypothetical protein